MIRRGRRPNLEAARAARAAVELPRLEGPLADALRVLGLAAVAGLEKFVPPDFVRQAHARLVRQPRAEDAAARVALDAARDLVLEAVARAQGLTLPPRSAPVAAPVAPRDLFGQVA